MKFQQAHRRAKTLAVSGLILFLSACVVRTPRIDSTATGVVSLHEVSALATTLPPTVVVSPTPSPSERALQMMETASYEANNGNDTKALVLYQSAAGFVDDNSIGTSIQLRIAGLNLANRNTGGAIDALRGISGPDVQILTGHAYALAGATLSATQMYSQALGANPVISPYLNLWIGEYYLQAAQPEKAVGPLRIAADSAPSLPIAQARREQLALALQNAGLYAEAVKVYDTILASSKRPEYVARMMVERSAVLRVQGKPDEARKSLQGVIAVYPDTSAAFDAINRLLAENQPVDELQRGIVDYHNSAYTAAQQAFSRSSKVVGNSNEELLYWSGLNLIALDNGAQAVRNFDLIIGRGKGGVRYLDALIARADALANAGNLAEAIKAYRQFGKQAQGHVQQSRAFLQAASLADSAGLFADAAAVYAEAATSDVALPGFRADALIRSAVESYRLGNFEQVVSRAGEVTKSFSGTVAAQEAQLWVAKGLQKIGDAKGAAEVLDRLAVTNGYFGLRARELARDQAPFTNAASLTLTQSATGVPAQERLDELGKWLTSRPSNTLTVDQAIRAPISLTTDVRFQRGVALWKLGFHSEADEELSALYNGYSTNSHALAHLAILLRTIGHYRLSISCAERAILVATGKTTYDVREVPRILGELAYPTYFYDLIQASAAQFNVDPILLFAVVRQESLFQSYAESSASARGLMQIVPTTGAEIAQKLGWPDNYSERDLNRPNVSLAFGASYLVRMKELTSGDWYVALSAYNAGAGRAAKWQQRSNGDPDLYYAAITLDEPRRYIRGITDNYVTYRALYGFTGL